MKKKKEPDNQSKFKFEKRMLLLASHILSNKKIEEFIR